MSPFIKIGVSPKSELDFITVFITDNGIGIAEDYFDFIFTPFKKLTILTNRVLALVFLLVKELLKDLVVKYGCNPKLMWEPLFSFSFLSQILILLIHDSLI